MPNRFSSIVYSVLATSVALAAIITLVVFGITIFVFAFTYIFIPLFIIASIRWLWLKYKLKKQGYITYDDKH